MKLVKNVVSKRTISDKRQNGGIRRKNGLYGRAGKRCTTIHLRTRTGFCVKSTKIVVGKRTKSDKCHERKIERIDWKNEAIRTGEKYLNKYKGAAPVGLMREIGKNRGMKTSQNGQWRKWS